jgi:outer membrane protein TolC
MVSRSRLFSIVVTGIALLFSITTAFAQERVLELSIDECIRHALQDNLNLKSYQFGLRYSELSVVQAESSFDPSFSVSIDKSKSVTPNFYQYVTVKSTQQKYSNYNMTIGRKLTTGTSISGGLYSSLSESNIEIAKNYTSNLGFQISQALLKGFDRDVNKANIYLARIATAQARHNLEQQAITLLYQIKIAYWNLVLARQSLEVNKISIEQADSLLSYNQKGRELGILTESDVLEARSALASRKQESLDQQNVIRQYEDQLRILLNITSDESWNMAIIPTDMPSIEMVDLDPANALKRAFDERPDYQLLKRSIEQTTISSNVSKHSLLPSLDLTAQYRVNGSGDTFGDNIRELGDTDAYGWSMGLSFSYPIGNRSAKNDFEKSKIEAKRAELSLRDMESQIRNDIRASIRNVEIARDQIDAAKLTVELNELKLRMEEERFRNKLSSSYYVLQYQRDLATSRNTYNRALINYEQAIADYQRVRGTTLNDMHVSILSTPVE